MLLDEPIGKQVSPAASVFHRDLQAAHPSSLQPALTTFQQWGFLSITHQR